MLTASMCWNSHVSILEEFTNYLDRNGQDASGSAIEAHKGDVSIISHSKEFCDEVATETWIM